MAKSHDGILRGKDGEVHASIDNLNNIATIRTATCDMLTDQRIWLYTACTLQQMDAQGPNFEQVYK